MQIVKRNNSKVPFDKDKIETAVNNAMLSTGETNAVIPVAVADIVSQKVTEGSTVEEIQDMVEGALLRYGAPAIAKEYILYRNDHSKTREDKMSLINTSVLDPVSEQYTLNQLRVLESRYLLRDDEGNVIETPTELFERIAIMAYIPELLFDTGARPTGNIVPVDNEITDTDIHVGSFKFNRYHKEAFQNLYRKKEAWGQPVLGYVDLVGMINKGELGSEEGIIQFMDMMIDGIFLPNSPTIMNAGARLGQLSACFVLPMEDNLKSIMKTVSDAALIFQSGGGVGINYSMLRPEGAMVASTSGVASGPISFMNIINTVTEVVKQGGKRRGANMGIIELNHPDIEKFIQMKSVPGVMENFNVSVGIWKDFWEAVDNDGDITLSHPAIRETKSVKARSLLDMIAMCAWSSAEPGLIFLDNISKRTPDSFEKARNGEIRSTNPCGEQALYPYESCNLGSINLSALVNDKGEFNWDKFKVVIRQSVNFLDNIVDMNKYPLEDIDTASTETRRIGLGIMGLADAMFKMKIRYNSRGGKVFHADLASCFARHALEASIELGKDKGSFPLFRNNPNGDWYVSHPEWEAFDVSDLRNVVATTIAPTGSIAMIASCSNGIEPAYSLVYEKEVAVGKFYYTNTIFEQALKAADLDLNICIKQVAERNGSVADFDALGDDIVDIFVTAMDIPYEDHIEIQAIWQKYIGNAVSKTINMPENATVDDVKEAYKYAHKLGLKGITIYRDKSRHKQVLHAGKQEERCGCGGKLKTNEGCSTCVDCGLSKCAV